MNELKRKEEYENCIGILTKQLDVLSKITAAQSLVREAVCRKNWIDFHVLQESMNSLSAEVEVLEKRRLSIFADEADEDDMGARVSGPIFGFSSVPSFYTYVMRFSNEDRAKLTETYRHLRVEVAKVQCESNALTSYINDMQVFVQGIIVETYPTRSGKLYRKNGTIRRNDMRSMVVNAQG
ncbi:MAG: hypothetical protein Ta2F_16940 [Termitinemataceae bacterium]|nr:MAG: hypothetical protein Ta2F_16940 [Termitinemataceae bacterium]